jgi:hypothetical protein
MISFYFASFSLIILHPYSLRETRSYLLLDIRHCYANLRDPDFS